MIIFDKKKAMQTIMSKRHPKDGSVSSAPMATEAAQDEDGMPDGRHAAAQDILSAMHEKSPQKLMEAMANFYDLHAMHSQKSDDTEPEVPEQPDSES
jgi:hypothetical protein